MLRQWPGEGTDSGGGGPSSCWHLPAGDPGRKGKGNIPKCGLNCGPWPVGCSSTSPQAGGPLLPWRPHTGSSGPGSSVTLASPALHFLLRRALQRAVGSGEDEVGPLWTLVMEHPPPSHARTSTGSPSSRRRPVTSWWRRWSITASGLWGTTRWGSQAWGRCPSIRACPVGSSAGTLAGTSLGLCSRGRWRECLQAPRSRGLERRGRVLVPKLPGPLGDLSCLNLKVLGFQFLVCY